MEIEKHVPVPRYGREASNKLFILFSQFEVGDSVFVPIEQIRKVSRQRATNYINTIVQRWKKSNGKDEEFCIRAVDGGVRVWRTK